MPPEIILAEIYHTLPFLSKLAVSCDYPGIAPAHARTADALIKRLKRISPQLPLNEGSKRLATAGRRLSWGAIGLAIPISFAISACSAAFNGS